jgi:hypothetical protein
VQLVNIIDEECIKVRRRLGSFSMPEVLELVGDPALTEVTNIISTYDNNGRSRSPRRLLRDTLMRTLSKNVEICAFSLQDEL